MTATLRSATPRPDEYDAAYYGVDGKASNYEHYGPESVPHWSLPLASWLRSNTSGPYLDVGCAYGHLCRDLNLAIELTSVRLLNGQLPTYARGVDWSRWAVANRVTPMVELGDARHLRFPDDTFNTIVSLDFLEHFVPEETVQVMTELRRVGRPQHLQLHLLGWHNPAAEDAYEHVDPTHCNFEHYDWYVRQFQQLGFVVEHDIIDQLNQHPTWKDTDWNGRWLVVRLVG